MTDFPDLTTEQSELVTFIRDQVCCPRIHGCELNGADECPAERARAVIETARAERDALKVRVAELEAALMPFAALAYAEPENAGELWRTDADDFRRAVRVLGSSEPVPARPPASLGQSGQLPAGWRPWSHGPCPVPRNTMVDVLFRCGYRSHTTQMARNWTWDETGDYSIIAYRVAAASLAPGGEGS